MASRVLAVFTFHFEKTMTIDHMSVTERLLRGGVALCFLIGLFMTATASAQTEDHFEGRLWAGPAGRYVLHDNEPFSNGNLTIHPTFVTLGITKRF